MIGDEWERRRQRRIPMAKPVQVILGNAGEAAAGPYRADLLDLSSAGLRCRGEMPGVPAGTRAVAILKVPFWLGSWQFRLPGTVVWVRDHARNGAESREVALRLGSSHDPALRHFQAYLARAEHAFERVVARQGAPSRLMEPFRMLQMGLGPSPEGRGRVVLISSAAPGEGKSFVAGNLAVSLARERLRALLVDADLQRPTLHRAFGVHPEAGLADWLQNGLQRSPIDLALPTGMGVDLIPAGRPLASSSGLWSPSSVGGLVQHLRAGAYPYVIIDSPPILTSAATSRLAGEVDDVLLVVRAGRTREREIREAKSLLERGGAKLRGIVLNDQQEWLAPRAGSYDGWPEDWRGRGQTPEEAPPRGPRVPPHTAG